MSQVTQSVLLPEEELIARICSREKILFHDLIRPYTRVMFGYADAVLRNPSDSEDAVQEAALKVFSNLSRLEDRSRFRAIGDVTNRFTAHPFLMRFCETATRLWDQQERFSQDRPH